MAKSLLPLPSGDVKYDPSRPFPKVELLYQRPIPTCPGKSIVTTNVNFPANSATPPHTHAGAFLCGSVISGQLYNKMNDEPVKLLGPGDTIVEYPGCRHWIANNASGTEGALLNVTMIVDTEVLDKLGWEGLVVIDEEYREIIKQAQERMQAEGKEADSGKSIITRLLNSWKAALR